MLKICIIHAGQQKMCHLVLNVQVFPMVAERTQVLHSGQLHFYFANFSYKINVIKKKWHKVP